MLALPFGLGLIEGFYGRPWRDDDRLATIAFLGASGYRYYIHAPKSDAQLRRNWREPFDAAERARLQVIAQACRAAGVLWGAGLSPMGLAEDMSAASLAALRARIVQLDEFAPELLCLFFDDMPRIGERMAAAQIAIVREAMAVSRARHVLVCPSYYSTDPVLERVFGPMPAGYWEELGAGLPPEAGIFWTGERVCSTGYDAAPLATIAEKLRRKPLLWDNYPVNDGARMADFLHIDAFRGRDAGLAALTQAHFVNPMNQCWLSRIPLASLPLVYAQATDYDPAAALRAVAREQAGAVLGARLIEDLPLLQHTGLAALTDAEKAHLRTRYAGEDSPFARELLDWLAGAYAFDPACLTD